MKELSFTLSQTAEATHNAIAGVASAVSGEAQNSKTRLASITGAVAQAKSPASGSAATVAALRTAHTNLLAAAGHFVAIHPYIHPAGDRRGDYAYLTPRAGIDALAEKLADLNDLAAPAGEARDMVVVLLCGTDHGQFAKQLDAFCSVFPVTPLELAKRRATQLATLEEDKMLKTTGKMHPVLTAGTPRRHSALRSMDTTLGALLAIGEGADAENITPEAELQAVLDKVAAKAAAHETAWKTLAATFSGQHGHALFASGSLPALRNTLADCSVPSAVYKLTALACWVGKRDELVIFREVFGV